MRPMRAVLVLAFVVSAFAAAQLAHPAPVAAAACVRFLGGNFDAPGVETSNLNGEYVRVKNFCATRRNIGGWKIHDYGRNHTYVFPAIFRIGGGRTVTLYTGKGTNTLAKRYWKLSAPVWNNYPPERAYLRNTAGMIVSTWSPY